MEPGLADETHYLDFEIEIDTPRTDGLCPVQVLRAPAGEATGTLDPSAIPAAARQPVAPATLQEARALGGALFDALFHDEPRNRLEVSKQLADAQQAGLRVRLRIADPALAALPWELLFDARSDEFLALSRATPLVRYLPLGAPAEPLTVTPPLRILALVSAPADLPPVDVAAERARLEQAVAALQKRRRVELVWLEGQTAQALQTALQGGPWHIFHYVGHARFNPETGSGELILTGEDGQSAPVSADELGTLLKDQRALRLVLLNACEGARSGEASPFAGLGAALVQEGLPAVVAMQYEISLGAAGEFTRAFYGALAQDLPVDAAVAEARKAMRQAEPAAVEWATPVLFLRAPDGKLWYTVPPPVFSLWRALLAAGAAAALVAGLWALIYYFILPTFFPTKMTGEFNIAVAEIGALDADGRTRGSPLGDTVSAAIFDALQNFYAEYKVTLDQQSNGRFGTADVPAVSIWHDSQGRAVKNVHFGAMQGATATARAAQAARLAARIGADVVVYGYVAQGEPNETVALEFYYARPSNSGEPDATTGNHTLGRPVLIRSDPNSNPREAAQSVGPALKRRAQLFFWITQALVYTLNDEPQRALDLLNVAAPRLGFDGSSGANSAAEGEDLFHLVRGQAALLARDFPAALGDSDAALAENADFVNALMLKGQTLYDWAQLYYQRGVPVPDNMLACISPTAADHAATTLAEAQQGAADAVATLEAALHKAQTLPAGAISTQTFTFIHMSLGLAYRVLGYTQVDTGALEAAAASYARSTDEFTQVLAALSPQEQPQYVGWTQAGLGATREAQWELRTIEADNAAQAGNQPLADAKRGESLPFLREAVSAYQACVDLDQATRYRPIFQARVLNCACKPYLAQSQETLSCLEGGPCNN